jgi:polyribonucleotide nucleotidyltransferase
MIMEDNDYTIRVVSEILESNGSSSMATVCAGSLALLDAGIPIKGQVSGIAMGLIVDGSRFAVLSDILGDEDHLGDMDFKVAGTDKGLTACQMDIKVRGLSMDILRAALEQSKRGRKHILDKMNEALDAPRTELSPYAPRLQKIEIPVDMIGAVIGSGGKVVQELQRTTGTTITIEEANGKGIVIVSSPNLAQLEDAANRIKNIITVPEVGTVFMGKVTDLKDSGAIIEFLAGKDGYLHISEYDYAHVPDIREVLNVGDELEVQLISVDERTGRFRLSRKSLMEKPEGWVERPPRSDRGGDRGGDRRGGGGGRGRDDRRGGGGGGGRGRY